MGTAKNITLGAVFTARTDGLVSGIRKAESALKAFVQNVSAAEKKLKSISSAANDKAFSSVQKSAEAVNAVFQKLGKTAEEAQKKISGLQKAFDDKKIRQMGGTVRQTVKDLGQFGASSDSARSKWVDLSVKIASGYGLFRLLAGSVNEVVRGFQAAVRDTLAFDQALANLKAITGATKEEMGAIRSVILDVTKSTKFFASDIAAGMMSLAQAGFTAAESMDAVGAVARLATATVSDFGKVGDLLTSTIRAFRLDTAKSGEVADIFANAINKSKLNIEKLRTAFNYVGSAGEMVGLTVSEVATALGILANQGLQASTMGTGLRQVLYQSVRPGAQLRDALSEIGLQYTDLNPKVVGFQNVMKNMSALLWDSEKGSVDAEKAVRLFGVRAASVAGALSTAYMKGGNFDAMKKQFETAGAAAKMSEKQLQGLGLKLEVLKGRAQVLALRLGEAGLNDALSALLSVLTKTTMAMEAFLRSGFGKATIIFTGLATAVISVNYAIGKGIIIFKELSATMTLAGVKAGALNAILAINPFVLYTGAAVGLAIAVSKITGANKAAAESLQTTVVEYNRSAESLGKYAGEIEAAKGSNEAYQKIIERLKSDHPELEKEIRKTAGAMDLSKISAEQMLKALRDLEQQKSDAALKAAAESAARFGKELDTAETFLAGLRESSNEFGSLTQRDFDHAEKAVSSAGDAYQDAMQKMAVGLRDQHEAGKMSLEQIQKFIRETAGSERVAKDMSAAFSKAMNEIGKSADVATIRTQQAMGNVSKGISAGLAEMQKGMKSALAGLDDLVRKGKEAGDRLKDIYKQIAEVESDYYNDSREIKQNLMTDQERYYDDLREAQRLLTEGKAGGDLEVLKKAQQMFKALSREVKDDAGNTVISIAESSSAAQSGLKQAYDEQKNILEMQKKEAENTLAAVKKDLTNLNALVKEYGDRITAINAAGLKIDTSAAVKSLEKLKSELGKAEKEIIEVDGEPAKKTIDSVSESLSNLKSELGKTPAFQIDNNPALKSLDGLIAKYKELKAEIEKAKSAGNGSSMGFATGGPVPGSGDTDSVPSMLTPGEYVIKKSAVRAVGVDFLHFINNMQNAGRERVTAAVEGAMHRMRKYAQGGLVLPKMTFALPQMPVPVPVQRFAAGGSVQGMQFQELGIVRLDIGNRQFPVLAQKSVGRELMDEIRREQRKKPNI